MEENVKKQEVKMLAGDYAAMKGYNNRTVYAAKKIFKNQTNTDKVWDGLFVKKGLIDKK